MCRSKAWGGLEMHVVQLARWLKNEGLDICLIADPKSKIYTEAEANSIKVIGLKSILRYGSPISAIRLANIIKRENIQFLSIHRTHDIPIAVMAKKVRGNSFRLAFSQHMHIGNKRDPIHSWQYRHIDYWLTPLNILARQTEQNTIIPPEKIKIIPQGIELDRFVDNNISKLEARRRLELPLNNIVIGLVGRLDPQKGQMTLIEALNRLHNQGHPAHVLLVGDSTFGEQMGFENELKNSIKKLKLTDFVHFRPFQRDSKSIYSALEILVLASFSETYGLVTIEGMASSLPIVATRAGGTVEILNDEQTGLLFEPKNSTELADRLIRLIENGDFAKELGKRAQRDAVERFSHKAQAQKWAELIRIEMSK